MARVTADLASVIRLVEGFLLEHNLIATLRSLELETGCTLRQESDDLDFLRELMLDGRWDDVEALLAPLAGHATFDSRRVLFLVRRQRFLELFSGRLTAGEGADGGGSDGVTVMDLVAALRSVEAVAPDRPAFNAVCYTLTLPHVNAHPMFKSWTPYGGRHEVFCGAKPELLRVYGGRSSPTHTARGMALAMPPSPGNPAPRQLERLLRQAAAAQVMAHAAADPSLATVLLPRSIAPRDGGSSAGARAGSGGDAAPVLVTFDPLNGGASGNDGVLLPPTPAAGRSDVLHASPPPLEAVVDFWGCSGDEAVTLALRPLAYRIPIPSALYGVPSEVEVAGTAAAHRPASSHGTGPASLASHMLASSDIMRASNSQLSTTLGRLRASHGTLGGGGGGIAHLVSPARRSGRGGGAALSPTATLAASRASRVFATTASDAGSGGDVRPFAHLPASAAEVARPLRSTVAATPERTLAGGAPPSAVGTPSESGSPVAARSGARRVHRLESPASGPTSASSPALLVAASHAPTAAAIPTSHLPSAAAFDSKHEDITVEDRLLRSVAALEARLPRGDAGGRPGTAQPPHSRDGAPPHAARPATAGGDRNISRSTAAAMLDGGNMRQLLQPDGEEVGGAAGDVDGDGDGATGIISGGSTAGGRAQFRNDRTPLVQRRVARSTPASQRSGRGAPGFTSPSAAAGEMHVTVMADGADGAGSGEAAAGARPSSASLLMLSPQQAALARSAFLAASSPPRRGDALDASHSSAVTAGSVAAVDPLALATNVGAALAAGGLAHGLDASDSQGLNATEVEAVRQLLRMTAGLESPQHSRSRSDSATLAPSGDGGGDGAADTATAPRRAARHSAVAWDVPVAGAPTDLRVVPSRSDAGEIDGDGEGGAVAHGGGGSEGHASAASTPIRSGGATPTRPAGRAGDGASDVAITPPRPQPPQPTPATHAPSSTAFAASLRQPPSPASAAPAAAPAADSPAPPPAASPRTRPLSAAPGAAGGAAAGGRPMTGSKAAAASAAASVVSRPTSAAAAPTRPPSSPTAGAGAGAMRPLSGVSSGAAAVAASAAPTPATARSAASLTARTTSGGTGGGGGGGGSMPQWVSDAFTLAGTPASLLSDGYTTADCVPALVLSPTAVYRDSQPIRSACFAPPGVTSASAITVGGVPATRLDYLALGTNNKALHVFAVPSDGQPVPIGPGGQAGSVDVAAGYDAAAVADGRDLYRMQPIHTWSNLHVGSVYATAWAALPPPAAAAATSPTSAPALIGDSLLATCSNDTTLRVTRWQQYRAGRGAPFSTGGRGDRSPTAAAATVWRGSPASTTVTIATDAATVRDVTWLRSGDLAAAAASHAVQLPYLVCCGGGDFGVRVYDVAAVASAAAGGGGIGSGAAGTAVRAPSVPLLKLMGHGNVVHAVRVWGNAGRQLVSCSADGTLRLWDLRMARAAAAFGLGAADGGLAAPSASAAAGAASTGAAGTALLPGGSLIPSVGSYAGIAATAPVTVGKGAELHSLAVRAIGGGAGGGALPREVVVGSGDGTIAVVDVLASRMLTTLRIHADEVRSIDVAGPLLLSASFDGGLAVSSVTTSGVGGGRGAVSFASSPVGLAVTALRSDHRDKVLCARWNANGPAAVSTSADKTAMLWAVTQAADDEA